MTISEQDIDRVADETGFSGVVRVDRAGGVEVAKAYGFADRGGGIANTLDTRFGVASGARASPRSTVVEPDRGRRLALDTTARSVLGDDLPLDRRRGDGRAPARPPVGDRRLPRRGRRRRDHRLRDDGAGARAGRRPRSSSRVLDGIPTKFAPGTGFSYCNGGFVVLALIAERASGSPFHELVRQRVCEPAGHGRHRRSCAPTSCPEAPRSATCDRGSAHERLHLPVRGNGDGGIYTTRRRRPRAVGRRCSPGGSSRPDGVAEMVGPAATPAEADGATGSGSGSTPIERHVMLEGYDAGVSFQTVHDPTSGDLHRRLQHLRGRLAPRPPVAVRLNRRS